MSCYTKNIVNERKQWQRCNDNCNNDYECIMEGNVYGTFPQFVILIHPRFYRYVAYVTGVLINNYIYIIIVGPRDYNYYPLCDITLYIDEINNLKASVGYMLPYYDYNYDISNCDLI